MKFLKLPTKSVEFIEIPVDTDPWMIRYVKRRLGIDAVSTTIRVPGLITYSNGFLQLEKHDATLPLGEKIDMLKDEASGFVMHGVIPLCVMEDGQTLEFCVDYMQRA